MKNIVILCLENSVLQAIADPRYCFNAVNKILESSGQTPLFNICLAGLKKEILLDGGSFSVHADMELNELTDIDLILVPALFGDMKNNIELNREFIPWLQHQNKKGTEIASLCTGAFLLAATSLLDGKKCSTHWSFLDDFRSMFPQVALQDGSIITEENNIYTSGGANSYWNLLLHLVEKYTNREIAILTAKYFAIDIDRNNQAAFALFTGQKKHADQAIKNAQYILESNIENNFTIDELAGKVSLGRRSFERRFKLATNNSVHRYKQRIKIEAAKRSLECSSKNINEVMFDVGYNDAKAFRNIFKKLTGLTPLEYRRKYNKSEKPTRLFT